MEEVEILQEFVNGFGKYKDFTIDSFDNLESLLFTK